MTLEQTLKISQLWVSDRCSCPPLERSHFALFSSTGITIGGLEEPLTVGWFATINCTTNITVSSIEWTDQSLAVLESVTNQATLDLDIPLVSDDLQGQQYTCRAETAEGTVYTETVEIQVVGKFHG